VGTTYLVGKTAIGDALTIGIAVGALAVLVFWKKVPEPLIVGLGALIGFVAYRVIQPEWVLH
jgi:chromate transporter